MVASKKKQLMSNINREDLEDSSEWYTNETKGPNIWEFSKQTKLN